MNIDWIAILAAAVASWIFGAAWYGALGRPWMAAVGLTPADMLGPDGRRRAPVVPMIVSFLAEAVMALVLAGVLAHVAKTGATVRAGVLTGAICWFGFVATSLVTNHAYARARPMLTVIDGGHWLGVLLVQGAALGALM
ncbi:MAG TPA: DUF1761 domain-containing protein [Beijerinckiaceae bacterium]|jgi:hypothetical protein